MVRWQKLFRNWFKNKNIKDVDLGWRAFSYDDLECVAEQAFETAIALILSGLTGPSCQTKRSQDENKI